jgi:hypothetical protein
VNATPLLSKDFEESFVRLHERGAHPRRAGSALSDVCSRASPRDASLSERHCSPPIGRSRLSRRLRRTRLRDPPPSDRRVGLSRVRTSSSKMPSRMSPRDECLSRVRARLSEMRLRARPRDRCLGDGRTRLSLGRASLSDRRGGLFFRDMSLCDRHGRLSSVCRRVRWVRLQSNEVRLRTRLADTSLSDRRERLSDRRERLSDRRERLSDRRERLSDRRERLSDRRERRSDRRAGLGPRDPRLRPRDSRFNEVRPRSGQ